jgi:Xaa-Pro aminopeptidase
MLISNEPGVYGSFKAEIEGIVYEEILGIRIEDDLLVTEDGCVNISTEIPKKIEDLEKILQT